MFLKLPVYKKYCHRKVGNISRNLKYYFSLQPVFVWSFNYIKSIFPAVFWDYVTDCWQLRCNGFCLQLSINTDKSKNYCEEALHKKMKFSIKDLFSKCDQICRKLPFWSHLLKKSLMENFIFCAANYHGSLKRILADFILIIIF